MASQNELQVRLQQHQVEHTRQLMEIEQRTKMVAQEEKSQRALELQSLHQTIDRLEKTLTQSSATQKLLQARLQQQQVEHTRHMAEVEQKKSSATVQANLKMNQIRTEFLAYREESSSEIAALKQLVYECQRRESESQATLDWQTTKLLEQEELLKTAISDRDKLATRCHELHVDGQRATEEWQAKLRAESDNLEALDRQLASLEQLHAREIAKYELEIRQLKELHRIECDVFLNNISEINQAHDSLQQDTREKQRLFEEREMEYITRLQQVERNSHSILEQSPQQYSQPKDQTLSIDNDREGKLKDQCVWLVVGIDGLMQTVSDLQRRETDSQAKLSAQERLIEQRNAVIESLRIENDKLSVLHREQTIVESQLRDQWKRSIEQESQSQCAASALREMEQELRDQVQVQADLISSLQAEAERLHVTNRHQSQAHDQCTEELRAEIAGAQALLEQQNQQLSKFRSEFDTVRSSLAEAKDALELSRRNSEDNKRSSKKLGEQCLLLKEQLQKAAAARRKAESALIRGAELAAPNSIADITRREIASRQSVERLGVELKATRSVCLNLKRQSRFYKKEIERLKSELRSTTSESIQSKSA